MASKLIVLYDLPDDIMLIVEHPSGVRYLNQVGGVTCWQAEMEGVLAPVDTSPDVKERLQNFSYPGRPGISDQDADTLDGLLASFPGTSFLKVDRTRMNESWEAWVYVLVESPERAEPTLSGPYFGPLHGFGAAKGVLTWPNSD